MENLQSKFSFWCPIEKAQEQLVDPTTGEQIMRLGGIASTSDKDADGEYLDPKGFDIKPLLESGMVNWHHQAKGQPAAIIGEPTKAEIRKEGLYIETDLYASSPLAHEVWELANTLEHDSKTRRLGYSIEGKVIKRKSNDKKNPDYNHIEEAVITGVAITHMPKNPKTFANIIKGEIDEDFSEEENDEENEEQKSVTTENAAALKRESLEGAPKYLTKGEALDKIFSDVPGISIEKAEQLYSLIKSISMAKERKNVTDEDIQKAYDTLGLTPVDAPEEEIKKGDEAEHADEEDVEKGDEGKTPQGGEDHDEPDGDEDGEGEGDGDEDDKVKKGGQRGTRFDDLEKAIADSHAQSVSLVKALGIMVKDSTQRLEKATQALELANSKIESLEEINKGMVDTINSMSEQLEAFGAGTVQKAAVHARPIDRQFAKGGDNEFEERQPQGKNVVSMSLNKAAVAEILDQATFANGYDDEFSKACMTFEAQKTLPANIIKRIKDEFGFEIVK